MFEDIIQKTEWAESHGAYAEYPGMGIVYYGLPLLLGAKKCVCLGSGAGFVPKLMYRAQEELVRLGIIEEINISLVDADIGPWGRPVYSNEIQGYPGIKLYKMTTSEAYNLFEDIDYLHVDADHSYDEVLSDLNLYGSRMKDSRWAITVHDTYNFSDGDHPTIGSYQASVDWTISNDLDMVNFQVGCGTALIMPKVGFIGTNIL
jgi:hypothetical protein